MFPKNLQDGILESPSSDAYSDNLNFTLLHQLQEKFMGLSGTYPS